MTSEEKRLDILLRHIDNVGNNCRILSKKLEERGEKEFSLSLIANGQIHDNSKFHGIEWLYLHGDVKTTEPEKFKLAAQQHVTNNPHHSEYWGGIELMPRLYIAEMCADWLARSQEFGQCLWDWINEEALVKYKINKKSKVYKEIKGFVDLLLEGSFK